MRVLLGWRCSRNSGWWKCETRKDPSLGCLPGMIEIKWLGGQGCHGVARPVYSFPLSDLNNPWIKFGGLLGLETTPEHVKSFSSMSVHSSWIWDVRVAFSHLSTFAPCLENLYTEMARPSQPSGDSANCGGLSGCDARAHHHPKPGGIQVVVIVVKLSPSFWSCLGFNVFGIAQKQRDVRCHQEKQSNPISWNDLDELESLGDVWISEIASRNWQFVIWCGNLSHFQALSFGVRL